MSLAGLLGCRYPIVQGGLAYVGNGRLAGAVSAGGGFGQVGCAGRTPQEVEAEIDRAVKCAKGAPIGVNLPLSEHADCEPYFQVIANQAHRLRAISLSAGNPRPHIEALHAHQLLVMTVVSTPEQARKAELAGADVVIAEGYEAGGHNGPSELTTMTLVPQVVAAVQVPVVAAGGIATGAGIAAALALGAQGVQLGTRFVATLECQAHHRYKEELVAKASADTRVIERSLGRVTRVLESAHVARILEMEARGASFEELWPLVRGERNRAAAVEGQIEVGWLNCGQAVGLIHDLPSAADLMTRLVVETAAAMERVAACRPAFFA